MRTRAALISQPNTRLRLVPLPLPSLKAAPQLLLLQEVKGCVEEARLAPYQYPRHSNYPRPPLLLFLPKALSPFCIAFRGHLIVKVS